MQYVKGVLSRTHCRSLIVFLSPFLRRSYTQTASQDTLFVVAPQAGKVWILPSGSAAAGAMPNGNSASQPAENGHAPSGDGASDSCSTSNAGAEGAQNPTGTGCGGLLIVQDNFEASASKYSHEIAGIIGGSAAAVESALLLAARAQPFFVAFVARKPQHAPTLFAATPTQEQYVLVFKKDL